MNSRLNLRTIACILSVLFFATATWMGFAQDDSGASGEVPADSTLYDDFDDPASCTVSSSNVVNLRGGPGTDFERLGQLRPGETAAVNGQTAGSDGRVWWRLANGLWVSSAVVAAAGNCESVPQLSPEGTAIQALMVYDDFDDPAYEGKLNRNRWLSMIWPTGCQALQQNSVFVFTNMNRAASFDCSLRMKNAIALDDLTGFEARIRLSSQDDEGLTMQRLVLFEVPRGHWGAYCGIDESARGVVSRFQVWGRYLVPETGRYYVDITRPAQYNRWYTYRLEIDPATFTISCYVDGQLIGSHIPEEIEVLRDIGAFYYVLESVRVQGAAGIGYVDDVRIIAPAGE